MHAHTPSRILTNEPRPVSMHNNDQATPALSKASTELVQGAVPEHAGPSACCPSDVDEAVCDTPKYAEIWQPSFSRLHAASTEGDMHSVEIRCILAEHDDSFSLNTQGALENTSAAAAEAADSQASQSPLPASSPAIGIDAGFFKSYAQHIKAQRSILCKTMLIQPATSTDCEDDLENRFKLRRGRTRERVQR